MARLYVSCCNCGYIFGRSAGGAQTELYCPKCGAEIEYTTSKNSVEVRMSGKFVDQKNLRMRKSS